MDRVRGAVTRRGFVGMLGAAVAAGAAGPVPAWGEGLELRGRIAQVADLTHVATPTFPVFPGNIPLAIRTVRTIPANGYYANELTLNEHTGTHMDAPAHFAATGPTADRLPPELFVAPLAVVDITERAARDPDAQLTVDDIRAWERRHGRLRRGSFVAMYSGWERRVGDPARFLNMDASGTMHFPGIHPEAAAFLLAEREIVGVGVDTLSLDFGASTTFGTHVAILPAGRYGLENLANLGTVHPARATLVVGGPKHLGASGGPARVLALA
jgi:kynurenine formamidase